MRRLGRCILLLLVPALVRAETPPRFRTHPEFATRMTSVKTVGVAASTTKVFELTAGNLRVFRPDWSDQAAENITAALESSLRAHAFAATRLTRTDATNQELTDVELLFDAVSDAILQATYANAFPAKVDRFEYSVGDLSRVLEPYGADALAIVFGFANISSGGRKALQTLHLLGGGGMSYGVDTLFLAIADRSGTVLWFDTLASSAHDLRDAKSAGLFVEQMVGTLPEVAR